MAMPRHRHHSHVVAVSHRRLLWQDLQIIRHERLAELGVDDCGYISHRVRDHYAFDPTISTILHHHITLARKQTTEGRLEYAPSIKNQPNSSPVSAVNTIACGLAIAAFEHSSDK